MSAALPLPEKWPNPFPGLRPFEPDEDSLFFGRERQTDELLRRLRTTRFLAILGTSGSGKSSLVRSGLIPTLYGGGMTSAGSRWRVAIMRPGVDPLANLAAALSAPEALGETGDEELKQGFFETTLRASDLGIVECVREARIAPEDNVLVLVDQFEELFRYKRSRREAGRDDAAAFVKLLLAARESDAPIYIALTMRSDFIGDCMEFTDLPEVINDGVYLVSRMNRDELRSAITGPVAVGGAAIAPRLVSRLLNDVGDDPDQLPILQHAMMRTWEAWTADHEAGEPLDLRHYEAVGTMRTALSRHADEAFSELNGNQQLIAQKMFKALTDKESDVRGVRRPVSIREIRAISGATTIEVAAVIDRFRCDGRTFLMPPATTQLHDESIIDISHESLMRIWTRLAQWADEESRSAQLYLGLARAASRHEEGVAALWRDPELQIVLTWRRKEAPTEAWAARYDPSFARAMAFLDASREERDRNAREKERRRRALAMILAIASIAVAGFGFWAVREKKQADLAKHVADDAITQAQRAQKAVAKSEAALSVSKQDAQKQSYLARINERNANELSKMAFQQSRMANDQTKKAQALLAEAQRLARIQEAHVLALDIVQGMMKARTAAAALKAERLNRENGGRLNDADIFNAMLLTLFDLQMERAGEVFRHWKGSDVFRSLTLAPDGHTAFAGGDDGNLFTFDVANPDAPIRQVGNFPGGVHALAAHGTWLAVGSGKGRVFLRDLHDPAKTVYELDAGTDVVSALAFESDGALLAAGTFDGVVRLWNVDDASPKGKTPTLADSKGKPARINSIAFHHSADEPKELLIVTEIGGFTLDPAKLEWDMEGASDDLHMRSLAWNSAGKHSLFAIGFSDGNLVLGEAENFRSSSDSDRMFSLKGHASSVNSLEYNKQGDALVSASSDGSVRLWDAYKAGMPPIVLSLKLDYEPSDLRDAVNQSEVSAAVFALDGQRVLTAGKEAWLWPATTKVLAAELCAYAKGECEKAKR